MTRLEQIRRNLRDHYGLGCGDGFWLLEQLKGAEEALERFSKADGCGCDPVCECLSRSALEIWKEEVISEAKEVLAKIQEGK